LLFDFMPRPVPASSEALNPGGMLRDQTRQVLKEHAVAVSIEALKADAELREALAHGCDFAFDEGGGGPDWFTIDGYERRYATFGRDGGGGIFATFGPEGRVPYVSSEGQAGVIAANAVELMTLLIVCPYWRTLVAQAGGGTFDALWRAAPAIEDAFLEDDAPENDDHRSLLRARLRLSDPRGAIRALHRAMTELDQGVVVRAPDGWACEPLTPRQRAA
jgi:hypothetical protein